MSQGIDIPINQLVTDMETYLWVGSNHNYYGRIFLNQIDEKNYPQAYKGGGQYEDVLQNDLKDATIFFDVIDTDTVDGIEIQATVKICFAVNLDNLYPTITTERATEYAIGSAFNFLTTVLEIENITRGIEAFSEYTMASQDKDNMQPYFLFSITSKMSYNFKNC